MQIAPTRIHVQPASHGGHHEQYSPFQSTMCKRWDTPSIAHPLRDLLAQRIYPIASGYADANDANSLRHDPMFKLGVERPPLDPAHD